MGRHFTFGEASPPLGAFDEFSRWFPALKRRAGLTSPPLGNGVAITYPSLVIDLAYGCIGTRANTRRVFEAITATIDALLSEITKPPDVVAELFHRADSAIQDMCRWLLKIRPHRSYARVPMHPYARSITREG